MQNETHSHGHSCTHTQSHKHTHKLHTYTYTNTFTHEFTHTHTNTCMEGSEPLHTWLFIAAMYVSILSHVAILPALDPFGQPFFYSGVLNWERVLLPMLENTWNSLPIAIKVTSSIFTFKSAMKTSFQCSLLHLKLTLTFIDFIWL